MTTAREMMTADATCVRWDETIAEAARKMVRLDVGALPICGPDERLKGMLTDRDIVLKVVAEGKDPAACTAGELAQDEIVTVGAEDSADEVLHVMSEHRIRRVPVIDGHVLVGIIAQADVARTLPDRPVGDLVEAISEHS
ncbi:CBS domain-containing protein [Streptomyces roseicoloratus]|uniref:CBS domain-containing protein n=1 Tax=Streptomyces roseicoloratus TaxID=2508722 RepID=A0ABY9RNL2_9ACTN|nr:CBS domain-containing protein [Streptomyces roseicoloratus]WMX43776.1 CBS domain-containing protein [Streptomyces roseicoloratus]